MGRGEHCQSETAFDLADISRFSFIEAGEEVDSSEVLRSRLLEAQSAYWAGSLTALGEVAADGRELLFKENDEFLKDIIFSALGGEKKMKDSINARLRVLRVLGGRSSVTDKDLDDFEEEMASRCAPEFRQRLTHTLSPLNTQGVVEQVVQRQLNTTLSIWAAKRLMAIPEKKRFEVVFGKSELGKAIMASLVSADADTPRSALIWPAPESLEQIFLQLVYTETDDKERMQAKLRAHLSAEAVPNVVGKFITDNKLPDSLEEKENKEYEVYVEEWSKYRLRLRRG
jgi:hypothetical protein